MDIFKMYERYAQKKGWMFEVIDITESDLKGYKVASGSITGVGVYGTLKFEDPTIIVINKPPGLPIQVLLGRCVLVEWWWWHGGKGGMDNCNGTFSTGGVAYRNADLLCELGSASGNASFNGSTSGVLVSEWTWFLLIPQVNKPVYE
ncbi:hypothetical protein MKX01_008764 [Papaver californicum]|nr:hypothetical protein MKX01_008764 [Papaver californicum]